MIGRSRLRRTRLCFLQISNVGFVTLNVGSCTFINFSFYFAAGHFLKSIPIYSTGVCGRLSTPRRVLRLKAPITLWSCVRTTGQ